MQNSTKSSLASRIKNLTGFDFVTWLPTQWRSFTPWHLILMPFSWMFLAVVSVRRWLYQQGILKSHQLSVPVIVVGNINVGGTGKTPLVIYLVKHFRKIGLHPGVISRGFGGESKSVQEVLFNSSSQEVGDEPLLIKQRLDCPVFVHKDRVLAGELLLKAHPECDIIVSDDGLQHYRMQRTLEIAVIDGASGLGNGALLPAGPLREPLSRLNSVDEIVVNGTLSSHFLLNKHYASVAFEMNVVGDKFYNLGNPTEKCFAEDFLGFKIIAVAGIGNPERFYQQLQTMNLNFQKRSFPDHHAFSQQDIADLDAEVIIMTEKDAVKCKSFAKPNIWVLPIDAQLDEDFMVSLFHRLESID